MEPVNLVNDLLYQLRLNGIRESLGVRTKQALDQDISYEGYLNLLLHDESAHRKSLRVKSLIKRAAFKQNANLEAIDFSVSRGLDKKQIADLGTLRFLHDSINLIISGPTGVGKSFLATALGNHACRHGMSVAFFRLNALIEKFTLERAKGTYLNMLKRLAAFDLLILDDFGIKPLESRQYQDLFDLVDERGDGKSIIVTTQVPTENWSEIIDDPVICEAITDRMVSRSIRLTMKGASYRGKRQHKSKDELTNIEQV